MTSSLKKDEYMRGYDQRANGFQAPNLCEDCRSDQSDEILAQVHEELEGGASMDRVNQIMKENPQFSAEILGFTAEWFASVGGKLADDLANQRRLHEADRTRRASPIRDEDILEVAKERFYSAPDDAIRAVVDFCRNVFHDQALAVESPRSASGAPRCSKPGCGAQAIIGKPCTDWDCPQATVSAEDYEKLRNELERSRTLIPQWAVKAGAAQVNQLQDEIEALAKRCNDFNDQVNELTRQRDELLAALREARYFIMAPAEDLLWGVIGRLDAAIAKAGAA
ncbi:hypothetical protein [Mesorhizobium sp.]|uniref:hypothetical protein n=1 Tax=Mesorhizobium sp. TaxID=1871066 RepID=UPI000FE57741|nr:hypothetical protein [Mesorhizobium sp.]RWO22847.1 MAG: hypothetical protein EOS09_19460 [Mesorhizobium sp.]